MPGRHFKAFQRMPGNRRACCSAPHSALATAQRTSHGRGARLAGLRPAFGRGDWRACRVCPPGRWRGGAAQGRVSARHDGRAAHGCWAAHGGHWQRLCPPRRWHMGPAGMGSRACHPFGPQGAANKAASAICLGCTGAGRASGAAPGGLSESQLGANARRQGAVFIQRPSSAAAALALAAGRMAAATAWQRTADKSPPTHRLRRPAPNLCTLTQPAADQPHWPQALPPYLPHATFAAGAGGNGLGGGLIKTAVFAGLYSGFAIFFDVTGWPLGLACGVACWMVCEVICSVMGGIGFCGVVCRGGLSCLRLPLRPVAGLRALV